MLKWERSRPHLTMVCGALALAGALLACGGIGGGGPVATDTGPTATFVTYATPTPDAKTAVQYTVIAFCQALSDGKLSAAYSYLTTRYKSRIGSASRIPVVIERTWGKATGCSEFGSGGFISVSGDHATDTAIFIVETKAFGTKNINGIITLAKSGLTWKIDSIS